MRKEAIKTALAMLFLLCAFGFAGGCDRADAATPQGGYGAAVLRVAQGYWATTNPPLCATTTIVWSAPPAWPGHSAAATVPTEPGTACTMWITNAHQGIYMLCVVMVHEYGHWMGYGWGYDSHSINYDGDSANDQWSPPFIAACNKLVQRRHVWMFG